jgi:hypothetical protein
MRQNILRSFIEGIPSDIVLVETTVFALELKDINLLLSIIFFISVRYMTLSKQLSILPITLLAVASPIYIHYHIYDSKNELTSLLYTLLATIISVYIHIKAYRYIKAQHDKL